MSRLPDSLESALAQFRPLEPSADLHRRVAEQLSQAPPRRRWLRPVMVTGLAASILIGLLVAWVVRRPNEWIPPSRTAPELAQPRVPITPEARQPWPAYAIARSPEAMERLLEAEIRSSFSVPGRPVHAFARVDEELFN